MCSSSKQLRFPAKLSLVNADWLTSQTMHVATRSAFAAAIDRAT